MEFKRPPTRRRVLADVSNRMNVKNTTHQQQQEQNNRIKVFPPSVRLPHNEFIVPNGTLAVHHETSSPTESRSTPVSSTGRKYRNKKAAPKVSSTGTDTSNIHNRLKKYIGPWQLGRTIGRGGCSHVRLVRHSGTGQYGAAKIISKEVAEKVRALSLANLINTEGHDALLYSSGKMIPLGLEREISIMKLLNHENIVRLYDIWESHNELYLIMEYVEGGELFNYIHEQGGLIEIHAIHIFRQILTALSYCHRINIHHRDLKPENILLDRKTMTVKLVDFGMAALQPIGKQLTTPCGSPHYAAPEVIRSKAYDGAKADVWSCGVILYVLLTGQPPFNYSGDGRHLKSLFDDIAAARYIMPPKISLEAQDLIRQILVPKPEGRLTLDEVWTHSFMRKYSQDLDFVGKNTSQEIWIGPMPAIENWKQLDQSTIDRDILRNLRTLWHSETGEVIMERLLSPEPNQEKFFYSALQRYHAEQVENSQSGAQHGMAPSKSDHHHNARPSRVHYDTTRPKSSIRCRKSTDRSWRERSLRSVPESPVSSTSYDPFRSSRQPMLPDQDFVHRNVTIHRGRSSGSRRQGDARMESQVNSLRMQALRNVQRSSTHSRSSMKRSIRSQRTSSSKRQSMSQSSLASSHWPSSPPVMPRSSRGARRGVSFMHLRERRSSSKTTSTPRGSEVAHSGCFSSPRQYQSPNTYSSSSQSRIEHFPKTPHRVIQEHEENRRDLTPLPLKIRKPESPTKYIQGEARKVSRELSKVMEEAFNSNCSSSGHCPPISLSACMEPNDSPRPAPMSPRSPVSPVSPEMQRMLAQRPLPPLPAEVRPLLQLQPQSRYNKQDRDGEEVKGTTMTAPSWFRRIRSALASKKRRSKLLGTKRHDD